MDNAKDRPPFELLDGEEPAAQSVLLEQFLFPQLGFSSNQPRIYVTNYRVRVVLADDVLDLIARAPFSISDDVFLARTVPAGFLSTRRGYPVRRDQSSDLDGFQARLWLWHVLLFNAVK